MYLANRVVGWSTSQIGRFYNGRDHSTVSYAVHRIEALREADPDVDVLIAALAHALRTEQEERNNFDRRAAPREPSASVSCHVTLLDQLADRIADCVYARLAEKNNREAAGVGAPPVENSAGLDSAHTEQAEPEHSPASVPPGSKPQPKVGRPGRPPQRKAPPHKFFAAWREIDAV